MNDFVSGATVLLCAVAALFFFRFRRQTRDRLFGLFAGAFTLLGLNFALLAFVSRESEFRPYLYLIRLAAFLLIIAAIVDKNRSTQEGR